MSLNQIINKGVSDAIDKTLSLKAYDMKIQNNLNVSLINGLPYTGGTVNVGQAYDLIQTNAAGTAPEWTENIRINDIDIRGSVSLDGSIPISDSVILVDNLGNPSFGDLPANLLEPGPANTVMTTNSSGTVSQWSSNVSVNGNLIFNGVNGTTGQFVKKSGGTQVWANIQTGDITPGTAGQVIATDMGGNAIWTTPPSVIAPGSAYEILETNSTATGIEWTNQYKGNSFLLTGNPSNFQSVFSRYYSSYMDLELYAVPIGGTGLISQSVTIRVYYVVMGNCVSCNINSFSLPVITGPFTQVYLVMFGFPNFMTPARLNLTAFDNIRQAQSPVSMTISGTLFTVGQPMINTYYRYYGFLEPAFELVLDNPNSYDRVGDHGQLFSNADSNFNSAGPMCFQYFI